MSEKQQGNKPGFTDSWQAPEELKRMKRAGACDEEALEVLYYEMEKREKRMKGGDK